MPTDLFTNPTDAQVRAAFEDGRNARPTSENPYTVDGQARLNLLAWAWDLGRRECAFVAAALEEKADRIMEQHRAALAPPDPKRWPFGKQRV